MGFSYHHSNTAASQKDGSGQFFAIVVGDFRFQLNKPEPLTAEEIDRLDVDFAETVGRVVEGVGTMALRREGVLQSRDPGLEGWERE